MRALVFSMIFVLLLALGALEIFAARGVSDADVPGGATVRIDSWTTDRVDPWNDRAW